MSEESDMARHRWSDIKRDTGPSGEVHEGLIGQAMRDALALGQLRDQVELRQSEVAARMGVDQGAISRLERREDLYLSTLREYVAALGGELHLVAEFPDGKTVRLEPAREAVAIVG